MMHAMALGVAVPELEPGGMALAQYLLVHPTARLTAAEKWNDLTPAGKRMTFDVSADDA